MNNEPLISRNSLDVTMHRILHLFVGRGKRWSVADVAAGSGVSDRMIEAAKAPVGSSDHRKLSAEAMASLLSFLGVEAQTIWLAPMGTAAHTLEPDEADPLMLVATICDTGAQFAKRAPGGFNHVEKAELRPIVDQAIARLQPYSSAAVEVLP